MLTGKNAVIYGVSPSMGGAMARVFAKHGATVYLTGRTLDKVQGVADEIKSAGGKAFADVVDALDERAVMRHLEKIKGSLDISFNLIGIKDTQNIPLVEMELDDFIRPIDIAMRTQFITATTAGRIMARQGSGIILTLTATPGGIGYPMVGGFGPSCAAIEALVRGLGSELGPAGVRVVNIRSGGSLDSRPFLEALEDGGPEVDEFFRKMKADTMLKDLPRMEDVANTAAFLASDMGAKITGVTVDITCGTTAALNYKVTPIPFRQHER